MEKKVGKDGAWLQGRGRGFSELATLASLASAKGTKRTKSKVRSKRGLKLVRNLNFFKIYRGKIPHGAPTSIITSDPTYTPNTSNHKAHYSI